MAIELKKATKQQSKLRLALHGPAGAGKTYTALRIAKGIGSKIALIDTERGSASKYADKFEFDVGEVIDDYHPNRLIEALHDIGASGYDVIICDSLTHFWNGPGGFLELVDREVKEMLARNRKPDSFAAWKTVTPVYNRLIQAILANPSHVICTMRAKMEYSKEQDDRGKTTVRRVGLAPEMRDSFQYEFDVEGMINAEHQLVVGKTRCDLVDGKIYDKPGEELGKLLKSWVESGVQAQAMPVTPSPVPIAKPASLDERIASARTKLAAISTKADFDAFTKLMKSPSTPDEIRLALSADWIAKGSQFESATGDAAQ